jgi:hypothetical protein
LYRSDENFSVFYSGVRTNIGTGRIITFAFHFFHFETFSGKVIFSLFKSESERGKMIFSLFKSESESGKVIVSLFKSESEIEKSEKITFQKRK